MSARVIVQSRGVLTVIGGGLAGSEAAWQAAQRGAEVVLWEMRPVRSTPAHVTDRLAELVCSNSLGSELPDRAGGLLKAELRRLGSMILDCADRTRLPAGSALAVDRYAFSQLVTQRLESHPRVTVRREEVTAIPLGTTIIATGPLTSSALAENIGRLVGQDYLYFYDALAPIVRAETIDMGIAFRANRYERDSGGGGDYINCPLSEPQYRALVDALIGAERVELRGFEQEDPAFFEMCLPVETLASRGLDALAYGPLRPVGLADPHTNRKPYAVVQLRRDDAAGSLYNIVGFQTNIRWGEQERILRMIPGLEHAEFVRLGQMHRNTFLNSPTLLKPTLQYRSRDDLFFAGQITGVEGYVGNAGTGLLAGINAVRMMNHEPPVTLPEVTMLGALCRYVCTADASSFQPMKANFGLLPPPAQRFRSKAQRSAFYSQRALDALEDFVEETDLMRDTEKPGAHN